jgi:transposase
VPDPLIRPSISAIGALDSLGNVYLSLTQSNSNSRMMGVFLRQFSIKLDRDRPGWREDSVILLDNASYHGSAATLRLCKELRLPIMFTGPFSYAVSPVELFWSLLKRKDLNPDRLPLSKGYFANVVKLVLDEARGLSRVTLMLLWHYCLSHVYRYLALQRL